MGRKISLYGLRRAQIFETLDEMLQLKIRLPDWAEEFRQEAALVAQRADRNGPLDVEDLGAVLNFKNCLPDKIQLKQAAIEIFATSATNPSCVFMEQFIDWMPDNGVQRSADGYDFLLSPQLMGDFLTQFTDLLRIFVLRHQEEYWYLEYQINEANRAWAEDFYNTQLAEKERLGDKYGDKWATDYFAFSWYYWQLADLAESTADYDLYLLRDSY